LAAFRLQDGLQRYSAQRLGSLSLYIKVAALLPAKSVRDVALRVRWMGKRESSRKPQPFAARTKVREVHSLGSAPGCQTRVLLIAHSLFLFSYWQSGEEEAPLAVAAAARGAATALHEHGAKGKSVRQGKSSKQEQSRLVGGSHGVNGHSLNSRHHGGGASAGGAVTAAASQFPGVGGRGRAGAGQRVSDPMPLPGMGLGALQAGPFSGPSLRTLAPEDLGTGGVRISGSTLELLDANVGLAHTIKSRLEASDVRESTAMLCTFRDNILAILHRMTTQPGIMAQMPPLPVRPNLELADAVLPPRGAMGLSTRG